MLRLRGGAPPSPRATRASSTVVRRGESTLPEFELANWRINASRAPGAYPGPATTFIVPTDEELEEYGNENIYPGSGGKNVSMQEFVRLPPQSRLTVCR